jgi:hypothetical protein
MLKHPFEYAKNWHEHEQFQGEIAGSREFMKKNRTMETYEVSVYSP